MPVDEERDRLRRLAESFGAPLPDATVDALLAYGQLLLDWNRRINLTGAKSLAELIEDHFPDAFAVAARLDGAPAVLDVGSGGGLPAIPAALLAPGASFVLMEPIHKKAAVLRTAARAGGLGPRVTVRAERLDDAPPSERDPVFDVAMSRATFQPDAWLVKAVRLVRPSGRILALSSTATVAVPTGLRLAESVAYGSSARRWLLVLIRST